MPVSTRLADIIAKHEQDLLAEWSKAISRTGNGREDLMKQGELQQQCADLLRHMRTALASGSAFERETPQWREVRELLAGISRSRAAQGFSPSDTARFVFSLKEPLFARIRTENARDAGALADDTWVATQLIDELGLFTVEQYMSAREAVIRRQQEDMLELSTPVVKLWDGILALPLIGTLDSARTQVVMESLLQKVVETGCEVAIIDITGVPTVDTLVAQHLIKTVTAARLMGAECIISGIRPQIAQTIVHLGVDLSNVITKAALADAFQVALKRRDLVIGRRRSPAAAANAG